MSNQDVIVVGAGPAGLTLAAELALSGVRCTLLEKRREAPNITRAFGVNSRTLELLDARGLADSVVEKGLVVTNAQPNRGVSVDLTVIPSRFNYMVIVPQSGTEGVLEARCRELGVTIERGADVIGLSQDADGVNVQIATPDGSRAERARFVVGCDGAHSKVREVVGAKFVGKQYDTTLALSDVRLTDPPGDVVFGRANKHGVQLLVPFGDGYYRSLSFRFGVDQSGPPTLEENQLTSRLITGSDFGMHDLRWSTRFVSERRQAEHYRYNRVFLAGDAAHVHSPVGAQGMNTGIGDAMNLAWKLAAELTGRAPHWLLDTYEAERHPVGTTVLTNSDRMFKAVMIRPQFLQSFARFAMEHAFKIPPVQRAARGFLSGLAIAYAARGEHPHALVGKRAPSITVDGRRLAEASRSGGFVLVDTTAGGEAAKLAADREITALAGAAAGAPAVMLVRPDSYVAWATDDTGPGLVGAVERALDDWGIRTAVPH